MSTRPSFSYSIIDAFASSPFQGNPAAVVIVDGDLKNTLTDDLMQKIAAEFNLSETAYITPTDTPGTFGLRWFTPTFEINLCGHATLASGFVLSSRPEYAGIDTFKFNTMSGELTTRKLQDGSLEMNFPAIVPDKVTAAEYSDYEERVRKSLDGSTQAKIVDILGKGNFLVVVFDVPEGEHMGDWIVKEDTLNIEKYPAVGFTCVNKTDPRQHIHSRAFAPFWGIPEDPVTGSYHCALAPYWSRQLEGIKSGDEIVGGQGGKRQGDIRCVWLEDEGRVLLRGTAFEVATGVMRTA
ncbi:hypothetical protein QFC22_001299 [Naganishia vaughanmartiniae]|uniref:Uncharacterized protein n=1 Tax=Naganishia vaughanmartiniae TaxID=1424756 RepID=A0ACC2XI51_9TREE|nr:hypothetical protein QFC22_001299 [Naganishia vaughanmartiniae]